MVNGYHIIETTGSIISLERCGGIWENIKPEVLYYRCATEATGAPPSGDHVYTLTFAKDALPARSAQ